MGNELIVFRKTEFDALLKARGITKTKLASLIQKSKATITNLTKKGCPSDTVDDVKGVLNITAEEWKTLIAQDSDLPTLPGKPYEWQEAVDAAKYVCDELFGDGKFNPDRILTFAGASSIFAGLVLASLRPIKECLRTAVYVAILDTKGSPPIPGFQRFLTVPNKKTKQFAIFVPTALLEGKDRKDQRIAVIDDTIISGKTMEILRMEFEKLEQPRTEIKFACFVCYRPRTEDPEQPPEIYSDKFVADFPKFMLPWGDSFRFEDIVPEVVNATAAIQSEIRSELTP